MNNNDFLLLLEQPVETFFDEVALATLLLEVTQPGEVARRPVRSEPDANF